MTVTQGLGWKNNSLGAGGDQDLRTHLYGNRLFHLYSMHSKIDYRAPLSAAGKLQFVTIHFYFWGKNIFFPPK